MILDIYKDSFEFASKKISALLILGVLSFLNILIIPAIFFYGYNYRVVKLSTQSMINGEDVPPEFNDFKRMFIDGLKYLIVYIAYVIIPIIVVLLSVHFHNGILLLIGFILMLIAMMLAYMAIPNMAENDGSLKSAFAFSDLFNIISSIGFVRYIAAFIGIALISFIVIIVVAFLVGLLFAVLGIAVSSIPSGVGAVNLVGTIFVNCVIFFIVSPYLSMFNKRCQGLIYNLRG